MEFKSPGERPGPVVVQEAVAVGKPPERGWIVRILPGLIGETEYARKRAAIIAAL